MKKQQLAAMVLSALSAGILISCTKPTESIEDSSGKEQSISKQQASDESSVDMTEDNAASSKVAAADAIKLTPEIKQTYLTSVANDQIIPAYQNVAKQSKQLNQLAIKHCRDDEINGELTLDANKVDELRQQWLMLAKAWATAEMVNFGPAMDNMSNLYINYYPDERGMVHQGVIDLIASNPNLTAQQLAAESAVIQGIPGMEEVLFSNETLSPSQCQYVISASEALSNRLNEAQSKWENNSAQLLGIADNDNSDNLGMNRWVNSLLSLVETTKSNSLDKPLGLTGGTKGHLPAAAAGQSKAIITAKVAALNKALTDPNLVALLAEHGKDTLTDDISTILADLSALLATLPDDIAKADVSEQKALYDKLTKLTQIIKRQLMPTLGVQVGFNSTDGD